jgi:hypothetical protein
MSSDEGKNNKPDFYRLLSDMSKRNRQRAEAAKPDESGRAGDIREPEMTPEGFYIKLCSMLPPKDISDKTTFKKIAGWAYRRCKFEGHSEYELCARILDFARESKKPPARNPRAVFVSMLKKELGYTK